jgi:serine phosphatase RsbU (regulator of sigma subunit)
MISRITGLLLFFLFSLSLESAAQTETIIFDGYTGILNISIRNDTAQISTILPRSPAEKAGLQFRDQIIAINDSVIAGKGIGHRGIQDLTRMESGKEMTLLIKRSGEDSLLQISFSLPPYLHEIEAFDFEYLIDSLEQWDIYDVSSAAMDSLFVNPLLAKSTIHSVEEGSQAEQTGIRPGDRFISLEEQLDKNYYYSLSGGVFNSFVADTSFTILRGDSLIHFPMVPTINGCLQGIRDRFAHDFTSSCAWLKITTHNRISENRLYLVNLPWMEGTDSANFFLPGPSGTYVEKRTGFLIPVNQRDFVYKSWHAASIPLEKGAKQTFYIRWKSHSQIDAPVMHYVARETMVQHDRIERMVLFALMGMMIIIACFFLILYFSLQHRQYLYFSLYILFFAGFLYATGGYLGEFQWNAQVIDSILFTRAQAFSLSLATICFLYFGSVYMELRQNMRGWYWSVAVVSGLIGLRILLMILGSVFNFEIGEDLEDVVTFIWLFLVAFVPLFLLIVPAIIRVREGFSPAWYFLIANVVLIPLAIISMNTASYTLASVAASKGLLIRILEVSGVYIASIIQILIFSIGLARKMRMDEREKKAAQERIIDQLKENEKLKDKVNRELEKKVRERTREISEQKEEIESQRDEIEAQRDMVFSQKKEITDSIAYAQRIQAAILPQPTYLKDILPEYFVLYLPRDIVSGDFYWIKELGSTLIVVAADCTGHGVPGAFMSMLGITLLNELFVDGASLEPALILGQLRSKVKAMLAQEGSIRDQKDGMDMAIAVVDREKRELQYAGAYNPLYLIRDGKDLLEFKGDKQPIGIHWEEKEFSNQVLKLVKGDTLYVFSDGFVDQYGGQDGKKFKVQKFKELLLSVQAEPMELQRQILEEAFETWRGSREQIDDVLVVGVRI